MGGCASSTVATNTVNWGLRQQACLSHSSGGWKSEIQGLAPFLQRARVPACRWLPSCCVPMWGRESSQSSLSFFLFCLFRAAPAAYGGFQARGLIRAIAAGLHHSHSHTRSEPHLRPAHSSWQRRILNPLSEARDPTHNLTVPRWICFCCATTGPPAFSLKSTPPWSSCHGSTVTSPIPIGNGSLARASASTWINL